MKQSTSSAFTSTLRHKKQFLLCLVAVFATFALQAQTIRYVKATASGTGNGSSWANASANLQAMINASAVNDQVWVAAGTYKPTNKPYNSGVEITTTDDRDKTFHVKDGVKIYGGFSASAPEATLAARNINTNVTILSGDIGTANVATDNCYHVIIASANSSTGIGVTIDGFSVTDGNANGSGSITVNGNSFLKNYGGGICTNIGTNTFSNNTLYNNTAGDGGGIYTSNGTNTFINNTLYNNTAGSGGGIRTSSGINTLSNNTLYNNTADSGGGIYTGNGTNTLNNNILYNNTASSSYSGGGGIYTVFGTNTLSNNTLYNNIASGKGGGIFTNASTSMLSNNIFWANKKGAADNVVGADYCNSSASNTFKNNLLQLADSNYESANSNELTTGSSGNIFAKDPYFVNAANPAGVDGKHRTNDDGLQLQTCSSIIDAGISTPTTGTGAIPTLDILGNAIFNSLKDIGAYELQTAKTTPPTFYSVTGGGLFCFGSVSDVTVGLNNSQTGVSYQLYNGVTNVGTAISGTGAAISFGIQPAGTYSVIATSADACSITMTGSAVVAPKVCCPSTGVTTLYVNAAAGSLGDGTSWATAYANLSDALWIAHSCSQVKTIKVAEGTYKPSKKPFNNGVEATVDNSGNPLNDRDNTFHIPDGVTIEGGYDAATGNRLPSFGGAGGGSILSGDIGTANVNTDNCYHVVLASAKSSGGVGVKIDGFSITDGNANGTSVINVNSNLMDRSVGGGIYTSYGTNTFSNNILLYNNSASLGGGIYTNRGTNTFSNNILYNNSVSYNGGGIYTYYGTNTLNNNTLYNNTASYGGGIYTYYATNTFSNNIFWANKKGTADNVVGADYYGEGTNTFKNNLLQLASSNYTSANSNALGTAASGNFFAQNPNFINTSNIIGADGKHRTADDGLQLSLCSVALDAGLTSNGTPNTIPSTDIAGTPIYNGNKDIGAYEQTSNNFPTKFMVTGSGDFCATMTTRVVGLSGSEIGVTYQLKNSAGTNVGTAINGTGAAISFPGNQAAGTYTVVATRTAASSCFITMQGSAIIRVVPICCPSTSVTTLYVNAAVVGGIGDGSSWTNAYSNLSNALAAAHSCSFIKTIKVAEGTYKPSKKPFENAVEITTTDARDMAFHIPDGVTIEGGYDAATGNRLPSFGGAGGGSILSGDIGTANVNTDNCYHVVLTSANSTTGIGVTIDGFTITGANANGSSTSTITVNSNVIARSNGGGIYINAGTNRLSNNIIYNNGTVDNGGGIYTNAGTNTLSNNIIYNNTAYQGGGIYTNAGTNTLSNNIIYNNATSGYGGGIYTNASTNTVNNNTIYNNSAYSAGGIYTYTSTNTLSNNIFWSNASDYLTDTQNASTNIFKNNLLQYSSNKYKSASYSVLGAGSSDNLFAPKHSFVNAANPAGADGIFRTADDGLQLDQCSVAIDAGTTIGTPALDILGNPIFNSIKDIGAYERQSAKTNTTIYVNASVPSGANDGSSWANAFSSLSNALVYAHTACLGNLTIKVAAGTYKPTKKPFNNGVEVTGVGNFTFNDRDKTFHIPDGVTIEGGYDATGNRDITANVTILSGDIGTPNVKTDNCNHVVMAAGKKGVTIDGFTITGGNANGYHHYSTYVWIEGYYYLVNGVWYWYDGYYITYDYYNNTIPVNGYDVYIHYGGGINIIGGKTILTNNTLYNNEAALYGGGIYCDGATLTISNNKVYENTQNGKWSNGVSTGTGGGAGISVSSSALTMNNNEVYDNNAIHSGAGGYFTSCNGELNDNTIYENYASVSGAGLYADNSTFNLNNNAIYENYASAYGAGLYATNSTLNFNNNTVNDNFSALYGGGLYVDGTGSLLLTNNILKGNVASYYGGGIYSNTTAKMSNNTVYENYAGKGGGMYCVNADIYNNTLFSNIASNDGAAIYANSDSIINNTIYDNVALNGAGGGIYSAYGNFLANNIFWENKRGALNNILGSDVSMAYSSTTLYNNMLQVAPAAAFNPILSGNITKKNPNFVNPTDPAGADGIHRTADDGLGLQSNSPAIEAGLTGAAYPTKDITGATREGNNDIGAYERFVPCTLPVAYNVMGGGSLCAGDDGGVVIGLDNSEIGISYQLKNGTSNVGSAVSGTGSAISFGNQSAAGTYTVVATKTASCTATMTGSAIITIQPLPTIIINVVNNCGNSVLTASGTGTSYVWSNSATAATTTVTTSGTYSVTATGAGGCIATASGTAAPKAVPTANIVVTNNCGNSVLDLTTSAATFLWSNAATTEDITVSNAGTYSVTVTAANSCKATANETAAPNALPTAYNVTGSADFCENYDGNGVPIGLNNSQTGINYQLKKDGNDIGNIVAGTGAAIIFGDFIAAGNYTVVATNTSNGCTASMTGSATITIHPYPSVTITVTNNCGNSVLTASGTGMSYLWSNGETSASATVNTAGTYSVTVTGSGGCKSTESAIAMPKTGAVSSIVVTNNCGNSVLDLTTNGTSFLWSNAATTEDITVTSAGNYSVTVSGADGCTATLSGTAAPSTAPSASIVVANNCGNSVLNLTTNGASFLWSNAETTEDITVSSAGTYTVTVSTGTCPTTATITAAPKTAVAANLAVSDNCGNSVLNLTTNGTSYLWSNAATTEDITVATAGTYSVTVSNAEGCKATVNGTAAPSTAPSTSIVVVNNCGNSVLNLTSNGTDYLWSNAETTEDITVSSAGTYTVTVSIGTCTTTASVTAAPKTAVTANIAVTNNCGNSVLNLTTNGTSYLWSNAATTEDITVSSSGNYSVTVTNAAACSATVNGTATPLSFATTYNITGGGTYCAGLDGLEIGLDGSQMGVSYQLKRGTTNVGTEIAGTGAAISFGKQTTAGTYSVVASINGSCTNTMLSPKTITVNSALPAFVTSSVPANVTVNCSAVPAAATPTASNTCTTISMVETSTKGTNSNECSFYDYVITRTWTATDKRGNTATKSQVITVTNKIAPTFGTVKDVTVTETNIPTTVPFTLNSCGTPATLSFTETRTDLAPLACESYQFVLNRVWTVTDICGNTSTKAQKITARGIRLTCPTDKTLNTNTDVKGDYNCSTTVAASQGVAPQFLDNCNTAGLSYTIAGATIKTGSGTVAGLTFNGGLSTVTYALTSGANVQTCSFTINIVDLELPKITLPTQNVIDACDIPSTLPTGFEPTTSDNCSGTLNLETVSDVTANVTGCTSKSATLKYTKSLTRTWKVTDASGNTATRTQLIYIRDMQAPTAVAKPVTLTIGNTSISVPAASFNLSSSDNCTPSASLSYRACLGATCTTLAVSFTVSKTLIPTGQNQVTLPVSFQVWDACSNKSVIVQTSITLIRATTMSAGQNGTATLPDVSDNELVIPTEKSNVDAAHGSLKCYPNPFSEDLNLEFNLTQDVQRLVLKVYDNQGRVVETNERGEALTGYYQMRWNLSNLSAGMYHVCLELDGKCTKVERVIMMK